MKNIIYSLSFLFIISLSSSSVFAQGCVEASSDEGPQLVGYIQPEFSYFMYGKDDNGNAVKPNTFYFRRARIGIVGSIPYDISYYVMAELSPLATGYPYMLDVFITYAPLDKYVKFSFGQFKSPFGYELAQPCFGLHTINRSIATRQLASPFRELQFMVLGGFGKNRDIVSYKVSIMNGTGLNVMDQYVWDGDTNTVANANKDIAGRVVVAPLEWLQIGVGARTGLIGLKDEDGRSQSRTRYGVDFNLEKWNFRLQGEYMMGIDVVYADSDGSGGGGCGGKKATAADEDYKEYKKSGFWVQAMYMTPIRLEPVLKYEYFDPDGSSYSYFFGGQAHDGYSLSIFTFGLNYFINDWTRIQVNYMYSAEGKSTVNGIEQVNEYDNDILMIQAQIKF